MLRHVGIDNGSPAETRASVVAIQRLLETDLAPDDADRLRFALRRCEQRLEKHAQHRRTVVQQLKKEPTEHLYYLAVELVKDDPDASQEEKDVIVALTPRIKQARAERRAAQERAREAEEREREARRKAMARERAERIATMEAELAQARERSIQQARIEKVEKLAPAVRGALKKAARETRTTTWPELQQKTGLRQLGRLDHTDKVELLALVEAVTAPEEPRGPLSLSQPTTAPPCACTVTSHGASAGPCPPATKSSSTN